MKEPLTPETKAAIRKMIREELRSLREEQDEELEQRVRAATEELPNVGMGRAED